MNYIQMLKEIDKHLELKYNHVAIIYEQTKELKNQLSFNDKVSSNIQLKWRGEEIEKCVRCEERIESLLAKYDIRDRKEILYFMRGVGSEPERIKELIKSDSRYGRVENYPINEELKKEETSNMEFLFTSISKRLFTIQKILEKTIELDSEVSTRIIGKDSFYNRK